MADVLRDGSDPALVGAIESNLVETFSLFGRILGAQFYAGPDTTWVLTGLPHWLLNGVWRTNLALDHATVNVREIVERFKCRQAPMCWVISPSTRPRDLAVHLTEQGLAHVSDWTGMAADLAELNKNLDVPPGAGVEEAQDLQGLQRWLIAYRATSKVQEVVSNAFFNLFAGMGLGSGQPVRHWVGTLRDAPVGRTTLVLAAGVAGIHLVATAPEARRMGIASAMVLEALRAARAESYRFAVLHSSAMAVSAYRRIGFKELCTQNVYSWKPDEGALTRA